MDCRLRKTLTLFACALLCTSIVSAQDVPGDEQRRIREVRIIIDPIYTEEQAEESSWASFTNRYHITTHESVIRTELLFKEGDVLDVELLESSERSLRRFKFVNIAKVSVVDVDDETVDVVVRTKEAWTLEPGMNIAGGGGLTDVSVHLIDFNFLGRGKKLYAEFTDESDVGVTKKFGYSDYQLFNTRWIGNVVYRTGPLVESYFAQARLPLYSPDSKWSYGASVYDGEIIERLFEDGEESSRHEKDQTSASAFLTRSYGQRFKKTNVKYALNYKTIDYSELGAETTTPPPVDQANLTPSISINTGKTDWVKNSYINKMGIVEDQWQGFRYGGKVGYGIPLDDTLELWDTSLFATKNYALPHDQLLFLTAAVSSEVVRNTFYRVRAKYYKKFSRHTLAMRVSANIGSDLDSSTQLQLGADSGLRGYPARHFTGEKLVLMNFEDRQYWGTYSLGVKYEFGTVLFVDGGNVWKDDESLALNDLNWSAGVGLRIGLSNMPKQPIMRIDYGWALDGSGGGEVTIGMEQHF